jgi:hypothetical protein
MLFRRKWIPLLILALVGLGCSLPSLTFLQPKATPAGELRPTFINHPAPNYPSTLQPFKDAGCKLDPQGKLRCPPNNPPFDQLGCYEIVEGSPLFGGLAQAPFMLCIIEPEPDVQLKADEYLYNQGCRDGYFVRYVMFKDGAFQLIQNADQLKEAYAPIQTADQALSYALAATGLQAMYGLKDDNLRYLQPQIEDTTVVPSQDSYTINLYSYALCGCGPHATSLVMVTVSANGDLTLGDPQPAWEDPEKDNLCVD